MGPYLGKYLPGLEESVQSVTVTSLPLGSMSLSHLVGVPGHRLVYPLSSGKLIWPRARFWGVIEPEGLEAAGKEQGEHTLPWEEGRVSKTGGENGGEQSARESHGVSLFSTAYSAAEPETMANLAQVRSLSPPEAVLCLPRAWAPRVTGRAAQIPGTFSLNGAGEVPRHCSFLFHVTALPGM